jgi:tetratricopeptide (TPR) repeat protein
MRGAGRVLLLGMMIAGCAGRPSPDPAPGPVVVSGSPDDPAWMPLDRIEPRPVMPAPASTARADRPALEAVQLYARSVEARLAGQRASEIDLLREALVADPDSYALHLALGEALLAGSSGSDAALRQFERAMALEPDRIAVQLELGRLYLGGGDAARAMIHLRLALEASDAAQHSVRTTRAHLYLARALQRQGHYLAAIGQYEKLLYRLDGRVDPRISSELWNYSTRRELLYIQLADLNEKLGRHAEALEWFGRVLQRQPNVFAYNQMLVRLLLKMGRQAQARDLAADLLGDRRADPESSALLREVLEAMGPGRSTAQQLGELIARRPADRALAYVLADTLAADGRQEEARQLLARTLRDSGGELSAVSRLFEFHIRRGEVVPAAGLLVEALAARPETVDELDGLWMRLVRGTMGNRLRLPAFELMETGPAAEASRLYWHSRLAGASGRPAAALASLEQAVQLAPAFAPAYRQLFSITLSRRDLPEPARLAAVEKLINQAKDQDQIPLATELIGRLLLVQHKPAEAAEVLDRAIGLGQDGPGIVHARAVALRATGREDEAEALLWRITHDHSTFEPAYLMLFGMNSQRQQPREAMKVLQAWISAHPSSITGNLIHARVLLEQGRRSDADGVLGRLFRDEPDHPMVIQAMRQFHAGRDDQLLAKLEEQHRRTPASHAVVGLLALSYHKARRTSEAIRLLEELRELVRDDADELFHLADIHTQLEHPEGAEAVLQEVLRLDPGHAPASNYLGYLWAEEGRNLDEAEALIRQGLAADPGNAAYLDSLGWVLYKRGQFEPARRHLQSSLEAMEQPDPVVLDHLGDALYRLERVEEAARAWQQALDRLGAQPFDRHELAKLRLILTKKLAQHREGGPVEVAPLAR